MAGADGAARAPHTSRPQNLLARGRFRGARRVRLDVVRPLVPVGTAVPTPPLPAASVPTARQRGLRIRLALVTGLLLGLVLLFLVFAGLSLPVSLGSIIAVASGYDVLANRGVLPALSGPWRNAP